MHSDEVLYISVIKHLLLYVVGYNNPVVFTDNANNELEKCNRNSGMDIWWLGARLSDRSNIET